MNEHVLLKLARENGFITHTHENGECYADIETLKNFAKAVENEYVKHFKWVNPEIPKEQS